MAGDVPVCRDARLSAVEWLNHSGMLENCCIQRSRSSPEMGSTGVGVVPIAITGIELVVAGKIVGGCSPVRFLSGTRCVVECFSLRGRSVSCG